MTSDAIRLPGGGQAADKPGPVKTWWVAARTFALPASVVPVVFGTAAAVVSGGAEFHPWRFLAALFGMAFLHTGANLLNDAVDFSKGLDRMANPGSGAVVRGWIGPQKALAAAALLLALGCGLGLVLVWQVGMPLLWIGLAGLLLGVFYSVGPVWLKARALGDVAVLAAFGVLGVLGAWTVQAGDVAWVPALWAVPIGLLVSDILHANNWRDMGHDDAGGVKTVARLLGDRGSFFYFLGLLLVPHLLVVSFVLLGAAAVLPPMPWTALCVLLSLPESLKLIVRAARRHRNDPVLFLALDAATGRLNLIFGLLYSLGIGIWPLLASG